MLQLSNLQPLPNTCAVTILSPLVALAKSKEGWESLGTPSVTELEAKRPPAVKLSRETEKRFIRKKSITLAIGIKS